MSNNERELQELKSEEQALERKEEQVREEEHSIEHKEQEIRQEIKELEKEKPREYVIFVDKIREEWRQEKVLASEIMSKAGGMDPKNILEALDKEDGKVVAEFTPNDMVDLAQKDRKFFRITPGGGGYS